MIRHLLILFFSIAIISLAQSKEPMQVTGDKLVGKKVNGENVREVNGNVIIIQGAVRINCDQAIQYLDRNEAELIGNVVVTQDSIIIKTSRGYYYGNTKVSYSKAGVFLTDGHIQLNSKNGYYYFDEKRSHFFENVKLKDEVSNLSSDRLNYYDNDDKAVAAGNVQISDTASTIFADSLIHFRNTKETFGFNNIRIYNPSRRLAIFGQKLEDYGKKDYSKITGEPFLIRMDTTSTGELDTVMISAKVLESYDDSTKKLIATDSVKIVRKKFASVNGQTFYYQNGDKIETFRREGDELPPVFWNDNAQLVADSINIFVKDNQLDWILMRANASIISQNEKIKERFDQISGKNIKLFFGKDGLDRTVIEGNVLSIYYMYEKGEPNGLLKSSGENAKMFFKDKSISDVRFYNKVLSEYHPENMIKGKEKDFTIPTFRLFSNRPTKESLLFQRRDILNWLIKDSQFYAGKFNTSKRKP